MASNLAGGASILAIVYFTHAFFVHSEVYLSREPYNEIATNYIMQADKGIASLLFLDAGYPPIFLRFLSWSVAALPLGVQPVVLGIIALILPLIAVIPFLSKNCRTIVRSDLSRFLISLAILLFPSWETRLFLSFTYIFFFPIFIVLMLRATSPWPKGSITFLPLLAAVKPIVAAASAASSLFALVWTKKFSIPLIVTGFCSIVFLGYVAFSNTTTGATRLTPIIVGATMWVEFLGAAPLAPFQRLLSLPITLSIGVLVIALLHFWWSARNGRTLILYSAHAAILANFGLLAISFPDQWTIENLENFVYFSFRHFSPAWQMAFLLFIPPLVDLISRSLNRLGKHLRSLTLGVGVTASALAFFLFSPNPLLEGIDDTSSKASWWSKMVVTSKAQAASDIPPCTPVNPLGTILDSSACELTRGARLANRGGWEPISGSASWTVRLDEASSHIRVVAAMVKPSAQERICLSAETTIDGRVHELKTVCTHSQAQLLGWYFDKGISLERGWIQVAVSGNGEIYLSDEGDPLVVAQTKGD